MISFLKERKGGCRGQSGGLAGYRRWAVWPTLDKPNPVKHTDILAKSKAKNSDEKV